MIISQHLSDKLKDPEHICAQNIQRQRKWLTSYLTDSLKKGINAGEFNKVPVVPTVSIIIAIINGLLRQRGLKLEYMKGLTKEAVEFCQRSLVENNIGRK